MFYRELLEKGPDYAAGFSKGLIFCFSDVKIAWDAFASSHYVPRRVSDAVDRYLANFSLDLDKIVLYGLGELEDPFSDCSDDDLV